MRRVCSAVFVLMLATTAYATADELAYDHFSGALGFHTTNAPVGFRWWLAGQKIGIDAGFGVASRHQSFVVGDETKSESLLRFDIEGGVPIILKSWDRVHFMVRPGIEYMSEQVPAGVEANGDIKKENDTTLLIKGELEAEVFLAKNFSVSASHGIAIENFNPAGEGDSTTDFTTTGGEFTRVGFHAYLFGGGH